MIAPPRWAFWALALILTLALAAPVAAAAPPMERDHITYDAKRKRQMAAYSKRHYGSREWRLANPDVIVLHFTASGSYSSAWHTFESNAPNVGERPGVCAHYVVKQSGAIAELVRPTIRCRHTIGLNHRSIGIEMVQETGRGSHWACRQILARKKQARAAVRLVRWLQRRYGIATRDVIGHAMANDHRFFKDLAGWRNDHSDWGRRDVREFRKRLAH